MNREEAIEILLRGAKEISYRYNHPKEYTEALKIAVESLKVGEVHLLEYERTAGSARGSWIAKEERSQDEILYECSVCGATFASNGIDFAYCPRCGSYMRE